MTAGVRVRVLGRFALETPTGVPVAAWPRPSARRLVQLLVLTPGHTLSRAQATELLFPALGDDERAARSLSKALSQARSALAAAQPGLGGGLLADWRLVWWSPQVPLRTDLAEHLSALAEGVGEADPNVRVGLLEAALAQDADLLPEERYEPWVADTARRLADQRGEARLALARAREELAGDLPDGPVLDAWRDVVRHDPTSEAGCAGLMAAYARCGRRGDVVRAYRECRSALERDLGVAPTPRLEMAYRTALSTVPPTAPRPVARRALVGRDVELALAVGAVVDDAAALLVAGPAGIGKTRLLSALTDQLTGRGWRVLVGTAVPEDRLVPYAALRSALCRFLTDHDVLPPELATLLRGRPATPAGAAREGWDVHLAGTTARWLDRCATQGPLALVVDDVQWADPALQVLLSRLATGRAASPPTGWTLLLAGRSDEPGCPLPALTGNAVVRLDLQGLDDGAAARVVRGAAGDVCLPVEAVVRLGAGNPFFLTELARAAGAGRLGVPRTACDLLQRRLSACSVLARDVAALVAVAAEDAGYEVVLTAAGRALVPAADDGCRSAIAELLRMHLLVEVPGGVRIAHPLLREALVELTPARQRSRLHTAIARALEERPGMSFARGRHLLAAHRSCPGRDSALAAARAGFRTGERARAVCADDVALELLAAAHDAAASLPSGDRALLRPAAVQGWLTVGDVRLDRAELGPAEEAYQRALAMAVTDGERGRCWRARAWVPYTAGDFATASTLYREGLTALAGASAVERARLLAGLGWVTNRQGDGAAAVTILRGAAAVLEHGRDTAHLLRCLDSLSISLKDLGRYDDALAAADRAAAVAVTVDDEARFADLPMHRASILRAAGRPAEALGGALAAARWYEERGRMYRGSVAYWTLACVYDDLGRLELALAARDAERKLLLPLGNAVHLARCDDHRRRLAQRLTASR